MSDTFKVIPMSEALAAAPYLPRTEPVFTLEQMAEGYARIEREGWGVRIEAARAAVDRIAAGKSSLEAECDRLGYSHEQVRAQVEAERSAAERLGLSVPKPNRPDEHWWVRIDEDMPLEPARVSFNGDAPEKVQLIGDDSWGGKPVEDFQWTHTDEDGVTTVHSRLELVERILPPGRLSEVIPILEDVLSQQTDPVPGQQVFEAIALLKAGA